MEILSRYNIFAVQLNCILPTPFFSPAFPITVWQHARKHVTKKFYFHKKVLD